MSLSCSSDNCSISRLPFKEDPALVIIDSLLYASCCRNTERGYFDFQLEVEEIKYLLDKKSVTDLPLTHTESTDADNMETYTTDDALAAMGFGKFQALVLAYAGMGWVVEAMELNLLSFVGPLVQEEWNVSAQHENLLSSVVFAGMLIGSCIWGFVSDKYG